MDYPDSPDLFEGKFTDGDPVAGIPASVASAEHMNAVYDELLNVITFAGVTPSAETKNQLKTALEFYLDASNLNAGTVPAARLSGSYPITIYSDAARWRTDFNSLYVGNNVSESGVRVGDGYAHRIWLDRSQGVMLFQLAQNDAAGTDIIWSDVLTITSNGKISQIEMLSEPNNAYIKSALNSSGDAPVYACRSWVRFNGLTLAIEGGGNVSSITDYGMGDYGVNLIQSMPNEFYSVAGIVALSDDVTNNVDGLIALKRPNTISPSLNSVRVVTGSTTSQNFLDCRIVSIAIFG